MLTEPRKLFDAELKVQENLIATANTNKWIVSDFWINNKSDETQRFTLKVGYPGEYEEIKRTLFNDLEIEPNQTIIAGNIILEEGETLYAYAEGEIHAFFKTSFDGDNNDLLFVSKTSGEGGNDITLDYINPQEEDHVLEINVTDNHIDVVLETDDSVVPQKASYTTDFIDDNNDLIFTAKNKGLLGNDISVEFIQDGEDTELSVDYDEREITVYLATDSSGNITTNANEIIDLLSENVLVDMELTEDNTGSGFVRPLEKTYLNGGVDANIVTTANDILEAYKYSEALQELVWIYRAEGNTGSGVVKELEEQGLYDRVVNLSGGERDKFHPNIFSTTGITIIGYGRVV